MACLPTNTIAISPIVSSSALINTTPLAATAVRYP